MAGHMCLGIFTRKCAALAQSNNVLIQSLKEGAWNNKRNYKKNILKKKRPVRKFNVCQGIVACGHAWMTPRQNMPTHDLTKHLF